MTRPQERSPDPSPALRALLDLPLRAQLSSEHREALEDMEQRLRGGDTVPGWLRFYTSAVEIAEEIMRSWDARLADLQRQRAQIGDPGATRQRAQSNARREVDRTRSTARQVTGAVVTDWQERLRRQIDHVMEDVRRHLDDMPLRARVTKTSIEYSVDTAWLTGFRAYLEEVLVRWLRAGGDGVKAALEAGLSSALEPLRSLVPETAMIKVPTSVPLAPEKAVLTPAEKRTERRTFLASLIQYVRGHLAVVGSIAGLLAVVGSPVLGSSKGSVNIRQWLAAAATPLFLALGYFIVRRDRRQAVRKGRAQARKDIAASLESDCRKLLERQAQAIERTIVRKLPEQALAEVEALLQTQGEAAVCAADERAAGEASEVAIKLDRLNEELSRLRTQRAQLQDQIVFELRRRARELSPAEPIEE